MTKIVALVRSRESDLGPWLLDNLAARPWAEKAVRLAVQIGCAGPDDAPDREPPPYDAVIECWGDPSLAEQVVRDAALFARAVLDVRGSEEIVAKGSVPTLAGRSPGISQLTFLKGRADLPRSALLARWSQHAPLAIEVHVGMDRYVQDHFTPAEANDSDWFGMAHLHFPDDLSLRDGLFRTEGDIARIGTDVAGFVGCHATMHAAEYVLKA